MIWIGDVHGCSKTLLALLKKLLKNRDVGFLGDPVDRGPDSVKAMKITLDCSETIKRVTRCSSDKNNGVTAGWT